jgi:hypothetical protein
MTIRLSRSHALLILVAILLVGFALRTANLGHKNVWWDEAWTINAAQEPLGALTLRMASDVHPPLYFWALHGWVGAVGAGEFAARFLSLIWGLLTVALIYALARKVTGRGTAVLAALLTATARFHVWWSQEARQYTFAALIVTLSLYLFITLLRRGRWRSWALYTLGAILVPYSFYPAAVALLAQNLFVVLTLHRRLADDRRFLYKWLGSQLAVVVAFLPWMLLAASKMATWSTSTPFAPGAFAQLYGTVLATGMSTHIDRWLIPTLVVTLLALVGVVALWRDGGSDVAPDDAPERREPGWQVATLLALPVVLLPVSIYLLSLNRGLFYSPRIEARYLVLFAPLFYLLVARGLTWRRLAHVREPLLALLLALNGWLLTDYHAARYVRDDYQTAMLTLRAHARPDDAVLLVSGSRYPVFGYYYRRYLPDDRRPTVYRIPPSGIDAVTPDNVDALLSPIAADHERLWLASFEHQMQDPDNLAEGWLSERYARPLNVPIAYNHLALYAASEQPPAVTHLEPQITLDRPLNGGELVGADLPTREFRPGDTVRLGLYVAGGAGQFTVHWVGPDGLTMAQRSVTLIGDGETHRYDLQFPVAYGPPGRYRFTLADGTVLTAMTMQGTDHVVSQEAIQHPARVLLGDEQPIEFLGYDLSRPRARPGGDLTVTLYWRAPSSVERPYTAFVQLIGPHNPATGNPLWGQHDSPPVDGTFPTDRWPADLIVRDRHTLTVDPAAQPGAYQLIAGMYDPATGERLAVPDAPDDALHLQTITIR